MNHVNPIRRTAARRTAAPTARVQNPWLPGIETIVGVTLIVAIGLILPRGSWGLLNINPHPLWIIAAAVAARYGGRAGYFAGALAGITYSALILVRVGGSLAMLDM